MLLSAHQSHMKLTKFLLIASLSPNLNRTLRLRNASFPILRYDMTRIALAASNTHSWADSLNRISTFLLTSRCAI